MLQIVASLSDVANVAVERKTSRSLKDTMEVDGQNVVIDGLTAKKLKLSASDEVALGDLHQQSVVHVR